MMPKIRWLLIACLAALAQGSFGASPRVGDAELMAAPEHRRATKLIAHYLANYHYKKVSFDDAMSAEVLKRYVESLDPNRSYFLLEDMNRFAIYRDQLDEAVKEAKLEAAFEIFKVFRGRLEERVTYAREFLAQPLDFTVDEELVVDRSRAPWARDRGELDDLWRKRVKNDVLNLLITGQDQKQAVNTISDRYQGLARHTYQLSADDVYEIFINSYTASVEPHTSYFSTRNSEDFKIRMSLSLEGVGAVLRNENEYTIVQQVVAGGPAAKSGRLKPEDRIVAVAQGSAGSWVDIIGWRLEKVVDLIRGPRGTVVRLQLIPKGVATSAPTKVIVLTREKIKLEDQAAKQAVIEVPREKPVMRIGVITLPAFYIDFAARARGEKNYRSTTRDVRALIVKLNQAKVDGIVMDLRGNGGGSLVEATELTGLFIPEGPIVQVRDASGAIDVNEDPDPAVMYKGPLAVLVDRQSASASEIFAAAIQDYRRGIVVGEPTFGKGTVQNLIDLDQIDSTEGEDLGQLKATVAQFFRINGSSTQHRGVVPDIVFPAVLHRTDLSERTFDNALPWDRIGAAKYAPLSAPMHTLQEARWRHKSRVSQAPIFSLLIHEAQRHRQEEVRNRVSLLERKRREQQEAEERWQRELEKRYREVFKVTPTAYRKASDSSAANADEPIDIGQVTLYETAFVLHDMIELARSGAARAASAGGARRPGLAKW
ncbi:carboxy terminal-processing peptidase [soil metagenome]